MKKGIIACGIISALIWLTVTFISRGIPLGFCRSLSNFTPYFLQDEIMRMQNGFYYDVANIQMPQAIFIFLFTLAFIIYFSMIFILKKHTVNYASIIIFFAVIFRFILLPSILIHENDIYRYIWDGKVLNAGINPYKYAPFTLTLSPEGRGEEIRKLVVLKKENPVFFNRIGYKNVPTIYPPFAQLIFATSNFIKRDSILVMKSLFMVFDILTIFLIYRMLLFLKMNPNGVIVYAWSPLVLKELANSGHLDSMAIFFLLCALFFVLHKRTFFWIVSLSLGILSKFFPLVTLPLFLKRTKWKHAIWVFILVGLGYLPFFLMDKIAPLQLFKGFFTYARDWAINGGIFEILNSVVYTFNLNVGLSSEILTKIVVAISYLAILFIIFRKKITDEKTFLYRVFWSLGFLFLLSPVGDPWYFCWVIPFLCFFTRSSFIMLSWLLIFSYLSFTKDIGSVSIGPLKMDALVLIQYAPFFILLLLEGICLKTRRLQY